MAKQLNVNMSFTADTSKAKQAITDLQQSIQKLAYGTAPTDKLVDPVAFEKASAAARELAFHLNKAYNAKTGNLDLNKLNASLKASKTSLTQLTSGFKDAGIDGQKAFTNLANAIAKADLPTLSINSHLSTMLTTLKNVARFQISSSIIHGAIGAIKSAYGYAQDLNESLNNIRIVTGQSVDQMAHFAKEANNSAKALSSSTLDYTNASLIYYQQGLNDSEVKERTEVTLKMANVSRQSAEVVSDQMTAIWNNFDDGSKSLEYYADVITALGAATASSSQEIATGLEKFAAVADTVGLSYENATAALATITATTRQSADTVGTGLRTLFSRLQGLKLGETLEDGVDLNKYSKALETVGVHALDASGELRSMDDILEDLGERWAGLGDAQKTALAQTVGGVRQYTNLIALMDNFDFYKQNQETAANAEGALKKQADIYAQSWEASQKRVKAAAEGIYSALIDDEFFIKFNGFLEHLLKGVKDFIGAFGGVGPILLQIGGLITGIFANKIGPVIQSAIQNIQVLMGGADKVYNKIQNEMTGLVNQEISSGDYTGAQAQELQNANQLLGVRMKLSAVESQLSNSEKMRADIAIQGLEIQQQAVVKLQQEYDELAKKQERSSSELLDSGFLDNADYDKFINPEASRQMKTAKITESSSGILDTSEIDKIQQTADQAAEMLENARLKLLFALTGDGIEGGKVNLNELFSFDISSFQQQINDIESGVMEEILNLQNIDDAQKLHIMDLLFENGENASLESIEKVTNEIKQAALDQIDTLKADVSDDQKVHLKELLLSEDGSISSEGLEAFNEAIKELGGEGVQALEPLMQTLEKLSNGTSLAPVKNQINLLTKGFGNLGKQFPKVQSSLAAISKAKTPKALQNGLQQLDKALKSSEIDSKTLAKSLENLGISKADIASYQKGEKTLSQLFDTIQQKKDKLNNTKLDFSHQVTGVEVFARIGSAAMSAASALNAIKSLGNIWNNDDATVGEKLISTFMTLGMLIPSLTSAFSGFQVIGQGVTQMIQKHATASAAAAGADSAAAGASQFLSTAMDKAALSAAKAAVAKTGVKITTMALATEEGRQALISELVAKGMDKETASMYVNKAATSGLNIIKMAFLAISGKITMAQFKEMAARAAESGSLWANTAAWIANQIAKNGWAGLVLGGLLIAAIAATTIAIIANSKSVSQNTEAQIKAGKAQTETAKTTAELVNAWRDQNEEMDVLISKYNQLTVGAEGYDDAVQAIIDKAPDLIEKYEELQKTLNLDPEEAKAYAEELEHLKNAAAAGDEEAVIRANKNLEKITTAQAVEDTKAGLEASVGTVAATWQKHGDTSAIRSFDKVKGNEIWMDVDGSGYDNYKTGEILMSSLKKAGASTSGGAQYSNYGNVTGYDMQFGLDTSDPMTFVKQYRAMMDAKTEMETTLDQETLANSDLYKELCEILERTEEEFKDVETLVEDLEKYEIDDIVANSMDKDITQLKNYAEYEEYKNNLLDQVEAKAREGKTGEEADKAAEEARKAAEAWLEANDALSEYTKTEKRLNYIGDRFGKDQQKKVTEYYKGLSDEDKKLFMQIDLDKAYSEKALNIEIARLKTLAEKQKIEVQLKAVTQAKKDLKESGMTQEDWSKIAQGINWDEAGISFEQFMNMSYSQQKAWLEQTEKNLNEKYPEIIQKQIEEGNAALEEAENHQKDTNRDYWAEMNKLSMMEAGKYQTEWGQVIDKSYSKEEIETQRQLVEEKRLANEAAKDGVELEEANIEQLEQEKIIQERLAKDRLRDNIANATSLNELQLAQNKAEAEGVAYSYELVSTALQKMAEEYDNCSEELANYQKVLATGSQWQIEQAESALRHAIAIAEMSKALDLDSESVEENTLAIMQNVGQLRGHEEVAQRSAVITQSMQKGIDALSKSWTNQKKVLTAENKTTKEYADTMVEVKKTLAQLLGITSKDFIPKNFMQLPGVMDLIDKAATGDVQAINQLGLAMAKANVQQMKMIDSSRLVKEAAADFKRMKRLARDNIELDTGFLTAEERFTNYKQTVLNGIEELNAAIESGADLTGKSLADIMGNAGNDWVTALNEMAMATNMSVDEMNSLLNSIGMHANVTIEPKQVEQQIPIYEITHDVVGDQSSGHWVENTSSRIIRYEKMPTYIEVAQIGTDDNPPSAADVTYAGRQGGGGGSSSGGGGGGGGGSKKPSKPERYHEIRKKIDDNNRKLDEITREKDRATGTAKLDLLRQEIALRQEAIELQQEYLNDEAGIKEWLDKDKEALIAAYKELGLEVEFDSEGRIANWSKLQEEYLKLELELTEEEKEKWDEAREAADQYEESLELLADETAKLKEQMEEKFDLELEGIQIQVELDIQIQDDKLEYIDYLLEKIDDDAYKTAEAIALLGDKTSATMDKINAYESGINALLKHHGGLTLDQVMNMSDEQLKAQGFTQGEIDQLREYRTGLLDANRELLEIRQTVAERVVTAFDELNDKVQASYDKFDQYNSVLEHYKNITDLMGPNLGKQSRELTNKLNDAMLKNAQTALTSARTVYEQAQINAANAQAAYQEALKAGDEETAKYWEEILNRTNEQLQEAEDQWLSAWENSLEIAKEIFESKLDEIQQTYNETMGGTFGTFDYLQEAYDRQKDINHEYLEDFERLHELSKLSRNISAAIDDTDSIKGKEKLRALQAEINKLQADGTKLSEYDVQVLEKKFELEKARLALDDAQNAKSQVRLQRDSEGNWGYVYTADEDKVAAAEQAYEDKLYEYQKLNHEYIERLQDDMAGLFNKYKDQLANILSDTTLDPDEVEKLIDKLFADMDQETSYLWTQMEGALGNQESLRERFRQAYGDDTANMLDTWDETIWAQLSEAKTMEEFMQIFKDALTKMKDDGLLNLDQYRQNINETESAAGHNSESFSSLVEGMINAVGQASAATQEEVAGLASVFGTEFVEALAEAVDWERNNVTEMDKMITKAEQLSEALRRIFAVVNGGTYSGVLGAMSNDLSWLPSDYTIKGLQLDENGNLQPINKGGKPIETALLEQGVDIQQLQEKLKKDWLNIINSNIGAFGTGFGQLTPAIPIVGSSNQSLDQKVEIQAYFPGVTSHTEIEEAFNNLVNKASQYANRKESY